MLVRKPVMLLGTLPRVIGIGEEMVVPATVFATEKGVGDVQVTIACSGNMDEIVQLMPDLVSAINRNRASFEEAERDG